MRSLRDVTLGDVLEGLGRYRPFVLTLLGILLLAVVLPGSRSSEQSLSSEPQLGQVAAGAGSVGSASGAGDALPVPGSATTTAGPTASGATGSARGAAGAPAPARSGGVTSDAVQALGDPSSAPDCNTATGRILLPSIYSPNCVPHIPQGFDNGGATWQGVTQDTITIAIYQAQTAETTTAIAEAGGATNDTSEEEDDANRDKIIEAYEHHFETYGRHIEWVKVNASGPEDDDTAAKADAIKVASEIKAFASFGAPTGTNVYIDELAARKVLCIGCAISQPAENYVAWGTVWSDLMASTQGYIHRGDYAARLAGKPAKWAGDPLLQAKERTFGLLYYDTPDGAYTAGAVFFERYLREKHGVKLATSISVTGAHIDAGKAQEESRIVAAKLKDIGITTVIPATDPLYPIFLTQEATRQQYHPEWMISGAVLQDTAFFGRLYDQTQWQRAFGISYLTARVDSRVTDAEIGIVEWHFGEPLTSSPSILGFNTLFRGVHLAGPELTPDTFREGMFSFKPTSGYITHFAVSYGRGLWPWDDYVAADDAAEIWWDATERGRSEVGTDGVGLYRYMNMGKRYLPGEWPTEEPKPFDKENTVLIYNERPPGDEIPQPPHVDHRLSPAQHKS